MTAATQQMIAIADRSIELIEAIVWKEQPFSTLRSSGRSILSSARKTTISPAAAAALITDELEWFKSLHDAQTAKLQLCMNWLLILMSVDISLAEFA